MWQDQVGLLLGDLRELFGLRHLKLECRWEPCRPSADCHPVSLVACRRLNDKHDEQHRPPLQTAIFQPAAENAYARRPDWTNGCENGLNVVRKPGIPFAETQMSWLVGRFG